MSELFNGMLRIDAAKQEVQRRLDNRSRGIANLNRKGIADNLARLGYPPQVPSDIPPALGPLPVPPPSLFKLIWPW